MSKVEEEDGTGFAQIENSPQLPEHQESPTVLLPEHHDSVGLILKSIKALARQPKSSDFQNDLRSLLPKTGIDERQLEHLEAVVDKGRKALSTAPVTFLSFLKSLFTFDLNWQLDTKRVIARQLVLEDFIVLFLLMTVQVLVTPAKNQLNSLAGLMITSDLILQYTIQKHAQLLFIGSIAALIAKLSTGFIIDISDPLILYSVFILISAICVLLMSELHNITDSSSPAQQFNSLATLFAIDFYCQTGMIACGVKYIHDHFRPAQWGRSITIYLIGGRLGSIISSCVCGAVVSSGSVIWEDGTRTCAILCFCALIPLFVIKVFLPHPASHLAAAHEQEYAEKRDLHVAPALPKHRVRIGISTCSAKERKRDLDHFIVGVKRFFSWWQRRSFVLMALTTAGMAVVIAPEGFDGFLSLYTRRGLRTPGGLPVASVTVFYHLGAIVSLVFGGIYIERLAPSSQSRAVILLLILGCLAVAMLMPLAHTGEELLVDSMFLADGARTVFFFIGLGFGYPFFVTVPTFAMNFGGEHSGLAIQAITTIQLGLCSVFVALVGIFANQSWVIVTAILLGFAYSSLFFMMLFHFFEWRTKQRLAHQRIQDALTQILHRDKNRKSIVAFEEEEYEKYRLARRSDSMHHNSSKARSIFATIMFLTLVVAMFVSNYYSQLADQYAVAAEV